MIVSMSSDAGHEAGEKTARTKTIRLSIEIDAPAEAVWHAISDAEELQRWFPLEAEVEPGVGGKVTVGWGPDIIGSGRIVAWEEGRRLRYVEEGAKEEGAGEEGAEEEGPEDEAVALERSLAECLERLV